MKRISFFFIAFMLLTSFAANAQKKTISGVEILDRINYKPSPYEAKKVKGYDFYIKLAEYPNTDVILGYYHAGKQYVEDTFKTDAKGMAHMIGTKDLEGGIYLAAIPDKGYFEFVYSCTEKGFTLETSLTNPIKDLKVKNSPENELFNSYQLRRVNQGKKSDLLNKRFEDNKDNKDSTAAIKKLYEAHQKMVDDYQKEVITNHPGSMTAMVINLMKEPTVPDPKPRTDGSEIDTAMFRYIYFKSHYFDNIDFSDDRMLRTPIFKQRIMKYLGPQLTPQHPDSITKYAFQICDKAYEGNYEVFKNCLTWIASHYEKSNIMGFDAIFVYLGQRYYATGKVDWLTEEQMKKVMERVNKLSHTMIGKPCKELIMMDINGVPRSLHATAETSEYTIVYFWSATCGHCKKTTPKIKAIYDDYKDKGLKVFAVNVDSKDVKNEEGKVIDLIETKDYHDFVKNNNLDWINVADPLHKTLFRNYYDIYSTPVIYIIDKDHIIKAKRLSDCQVREYMMRFLDKMSDEELEKWRNENCKDEPEHSDEDESKDEKSNTDSN